jgi:SPP1 gp7 family putative phage head morphogenesis protein
MEGNILKRLDPALRANIKTIQHLMPEQYQASFFEHAWAIDQATGVRLDWGQVSTKANLAAMDIANPKNIEIANALKNYTIDAKKHIRSALLNGLTLGKSYPQMAKDLEKANLKIASNAMTIVRTEGQRAQNKGQDDAYLKAIENGVEGVMVWDATFDDRTRPEHAAMDGVVKSKDGYYHGAIGKAEYPGDPNLPPEQSINCRCHERFEISGYAPQLVRTRAEGVLPFQSFKDYANEYHPDWLDRKGFQSMKGG